MLRLRLSRSTRGRDVRLSRGLPEREFRAVDARDVRASFVSFERGRVERDVRESDERVESSRRGRDVSSRRGRDVRLSRDWVAREVRGFDEREVVVLLPRSELGRVERVSRLPVDSLDSFRRARELVDEPPRVGLALPEFRDLPLEATLDFELRLCGRDEREVLAEL